jgi:hypothetical protein
MDTKYSLTTLLNNLLKLQNNGYQIITKLSDVVSSNADIVEVDVIDGSGVIQKVYVPSYGSLKNQIVKLENDIKNISGIGDTSSSVQLSDGSFRKILVSSLKKEASDIQRMQLPTTFNKKENWFFESFLNPLLYVTFDLTNQIKYETENIEVARYILNLDTDEKLRIFSDRFFQKSDIKFQDFVRILLDNDIQYFLDKEVIDMPPRSIRFSGNFTVTDVFDDTITETVNSTTLQKRVLRVKLDKLTYDDNQSNFLGTQQLKIGDSLIVNSGRNNTRYEIVNIEPSTRIISVRLIEGFDPILIGKDVLNFYGEDLVPVIAEVPIGFNEYCVIFVKPIDPDSRIQSVNWSPGVGMYTNDLSIVDPTTGKTISLSSYYQNEVVDFGAYLYSTVKDKTPSAIYGVIPDSPTLDSANFKVLQINEHLTSTGSFQSLQKLQADKLRVQSQIKSLDNSIAQLRTKTQSTKYSSQKLFDTDNNDLTRLINDRSSQSTLYASIIDDINKISVSENVDSLTPKYRVRGFFPIPVAKNSERTTPQEVVQFSIQYRYLKKDGSANSPKQIEFADNNGQTRRGTFSPWVEYKTDIRKRRLDPDTGIATWMVEDVENADTVNINQIDIPIQQGEAIEFRVKSISEAGWPVTPLESDYSNIIRVDFPTEFESIPSATSIIEQSKKEQVKVDLQSELVNMNLDKVSASTISLGGKFYTADSMHIASGFLTPENNIISLFDKLNQMDQEITRLRSLLANAKGILTVKIVDEDGQEYSVQNNSTVRIFAGNYKDQVAALPIKKGVIITKNYFVKLINNTASNLEMYSRVYGSRYVTVNSSVSGGIGYNGSDSDYNVTRRYDFVPVGLSNPSLDSASGYSFINQIPSQSEQVKSQFVNSRYLAVDGKDVLYSPIDSSGLSIDSLFYLGSGVSFSDFLDQKEWTGSIPSSFSSAQIGSSSDFIWKGGTSTDKISYTQINSNDYSNGLFVHINHPEIKSWIDESENNPTIVNTITVPKYVRNSILSNIPKPNIGYNYQTAVCKEGGIGSNSNIYAKIGFSENDKYLIGPRSVGAYLFLNPNSHKNIIVDGSESISVKNISLGNSNAISIPVTFQYRMTDYFGSGDSGLGNVGGIPSAGPNTNIEYTKTIGLDIYSNPLDKERFSFDIEITARYYSKSLISKDIPSRTFESAIDDLNNTLKVLNPQTSRDVA